MLLLLGAVAYERADYAAAAPALALLTASYVAPGRGEPAAAERLAGEALALFRRCRDRWGEAQALTGLGVAALLRRDPAAALARHREALDAALEPLARAQVLGRAGWAALASGQPAPALGYLREGVGLAAQLGNLEVVVSCLGALARATAGAEPARAARLLGAGAALRERIGVPVWPALRPLYDATWAELRRRLSPTSWARATAAGRALTVDEAVAEALAEPDGSPLSARELQVARLIARGLISKEIAAALVITEATADSHAAHIRRKLALRSRAEIAAWAVRQGLDPA